MKVLFAYAEGENGVLKRLEKLDGMELPLPLFARIHKLLMLIRGEASIYMPRREKILKDLCIMEDGEGGNKLWMFPKPGDEKYPEFEKKWNELQLAELEFEYSPIDYLKIIEDTPEEIKNKITATGKDFDILDALNETYKHENSPADTSAGEANKGPESPKADA